MKFYNPFKFHIFKVGELYCVKRRSAFLFYNEYVDLTDGYIWGDTTQYFLKYCFGTYEQSNKALALSRINKIINSKLIE